ncbi:MAG: D-alanyl-D-alanine carboxypeptidase [Rhodobacteraceae bacterium]|nr:D-alanyl-D-alanine carboxypeptidase [Paracoccaceae bacterium]
MTHRLPPLFAALVAIVLALPAAAFDTAATAAYVVDVNTGTVLLNKDGDTPMPPASMSKLMTIDLLFQALAAGRVQLDTPFTVSTRAKNMGGSTMFLNERDRPTVEQLIQGIIVLSGNDACVTVAEGLAGSEEAFAEQMNIEAKKLGLTNSHYANASGWPDPGQLMSMHDLATLAIHIMKTYPQYYHYFSEQSFAYDGRAPANEDNRDPLLGRVPGADGMKTGHTEASGYGLVGTAVQGGRRVLVVLNGMTSMAGRGTEGEKLLNWAFRQFAEKTVAKKGAVVATAPVWMGQATSVGLVPAEDATVLLPVTAGASIDAKVVYSGPVRAPIKAGQKLADLVISEAGMEDRQIPLVAAADVPQGGYMRRIETAVIVLSRKFGGAAATQ